MTGPKGEKVVYKKDRSKEPKKPMTNIMSSLTMRMLIRKGLSTYSCNVRKMEEEELRPEDVLVVNKHLDMYHDE